MLIPAVYILDTRHSNEYGEAGVIMKVYSWGATDVGMKREHNEDSYLIVPDLNLYVVADGMGGHASGEMASGVAIHSIDQTIKSQRDIIAPEAKHKVPLSDNPVAQLVSHAVRQASYAVFTEGQRNPSLRGMGTTATCMIFHDGHGFIGHVGDSRCYLMRNGQIVQLSEDHSLVNQQVKLKMITEEQAKESRFKNIITRSVGFEADVEVDVIAVEVMPRDVFLICSDGLTGHVNDEELNALVNQNFLHELPGRLIDLANERGGEDNITVILAYVPDEHDAPFPDGSDGVDPMPGGAAYNAGFIE